MNVRALLSFLPFERFRNPPPVVAVVRLTGIIGRLSPLHKGLSIAGMAGVLERAFRLSNLRAVALVVNSPGGSPVQSSLIAGRIRALAAEHKVPVYAFAEDVAASGGYWLLTAGDELWANESSIVGSIGVVSAGFGFPEALRRMGIERRVYTAGERKAALDPFQPEKPEEVEHLKRLQADVHEAFCRQVRERRQGKLKGGENELFSGRFWAGRAALDLGLIDGIGELRTVLRQKFGEKVRLKLIGERTPWLRRRLGLPAIAGANAAPPGGTLPEQVVAAIEDHLAWSQYRL